MTMKNKNIRRTTEIDQENIQNEMKKFVPCAMLSVGVRIDMFRCWMYRLSNQETDSSQLSQRGASADNPYALMNA